MGGLPFYWSIEISLVFKLEWDTQLPPPPPKFPNSPIQGMGKWQRARSPPIPSWKGGSQKARCKGPSRMAKDGNGCAHCHPYHGVGWEDGLLTTSYHLAVLAGSPKPWQFSTTGALQSSERQSLHGRVPWISTSLVPSLMGSNRENSLLKWGGSRDGAPKGGSRMVGICRGDSSQLSKVVGR